MGLAFYIASSLSNAKNVQQLAATLKALGHFQTYDWTRHELIAEQQDQIKKQDQIKTSVAEIRGVVHADYLVVLLPGGFGTHVEIGAAIARGVPVYLIGKESEKIGPNGYPCIFYSHPLVRVFESGIAFLEIFK